MYFRLSNPTIEACDEEEMKALEKTKVDLKKTQTSLSELHQGIKPFIQLLSRIHFMRDLMQ